MNNTNNIKVSIIIPVYNVEQYIKQCLDSVINQTLKDIEIICIDDKSTDNSLQILKEYKEKDDRIVLIEQAVNQGQGVARNIGIENAKGEYIMFLDSDDWYELNACEELYNSITVNNTDITICRHKAFDISNNNISKVHYSLKNKLLPGDYFAPTDIANVIFQFCVGWPWDKIYKKSMVDKYNLRFSNLQNTEDTFFVLFSLCIANKINIIDDYLVIHRIGIQSSVSNIKSKKPLCFLEALQELYDNLNKYNLYYLYKPVLKNM